MQRVARVCQRQLILVTRLEAGLQPNIGNFTARFGGVHVLRYNSTKREPILLKPGVLDVHSLGLALADFGRDPRSSGSWKARKKF